MRTYDVELLKRATEPYKEAFFGFNPEAMVKNKMNVILTNENEDVVIFERERYSVATGHYFLKSRGKAAIAACEEFLKEIFNPDYGVKIIIGMTPLENRAALWMNQRLGFQNIEVMPTIQGPQQFVILTRREWRSKRKL